MKKEPKKPMTSALFPDVPGKDLSSNWPQDAAESPNMRGKELGPDPDLREDGAELPDMQGKDPSEDSPADDAVLETEELYEGISSDSPPSSKIKNSNKPDPVESSDSEK